MKKFILTNLFIGLFHLANAQKTGSLSLSFENYVGTEMVSLNNKNYKNNVGEQFNINLLQYYVSNFRLTKQDGSEYIVPKDECYFLIKESEPSSKNISLKNIPKGKYTGVKFIIGIDSLKSASDITERKGCLDIGGEGKDMYWAWNSGYIFVKMEGTSPQILKDNSIYNYHIGFFGGIREKRTLNNIKNVSLSLGDFKMKQKSSKLAVIKTDVSKIMNGETNISMAQNHSVMGGPLSAKIANNYETMFTFSGFKQ